MIWTTDNLLQATGGELVSGDRQHRFSGVSIDSRTITDGQLFIAIRGDVHDGHRFAAEAVRMGAHGVVISKAWTHLAAGESWPKKGVVCIRVDDTTKALGDLAAFIRRTSRVSVVAITGSNGKTTTRGLTSAILSQRYHILSTRGNFNNLIGVPLMLLDLEPVHELAVLELGMNRPGEIARLGHICRPDVGVITNIGPAHLEGFDSIEGIMHAKSELLGTINSGGVLVLNADDSRTRRLARQALHPVLFFGLCRGASISARAIRSTAEGIDFDLVLPSASIRLHLNLPGIFMVVNCLAAAAVGHHMGLTPEEIKTGVAGFKPDKGRVNIHHTARGVHLIDDTYNANPESMAAAIVLLQSLKGAGRSVLVAGDMLELGEYAESMHRNIGSQAARSNMAKIYATGSYAEAVAAGARDEGMPQDDIITAKREDISEDLKQWLQPGDWVLIKGSRKMEMETVFYNLKTWADSME